MLTLSLFWIRLRDAQLHWFEANNRSCISWACYSSIFYYSKILYIPSAARAGKVYLTKHFDILKWKAPRLLASPNPFPAEQRSTQPPQLSQIGEEHVWKRDAKWPSDADRSAHPWVEKKPFGQLKSCWWAPYMGHGFLLCPGPLVSFKRYLRALDWPIFIIFFKKSIISECQSLIHFMSLMSCHCGLCPTVSCPPDQYDTTQRCVSYNKQTQRCEAVYPKQVIPPNGHPINRKSGWDGFFSDWIIVTLRPYPWCLQPAGLQLRNASQLPKMRCESRVAPTGNDGFPLAGDEGQQRSSYSLPTEGKCCSAPISPNKLKACKKTSWKSLVM